MRSQVVLHVAAAMACLASLVTVPLACGSSSGGGPGLSLDGGGPGGGNNGVRGHISVTTSAVGSTSAVCGVTGGVITAFGPFDFACNVDLDGGSESVAEISLPTYHGTDSYTVVGTQHLDAGTVQLTLNNYDVLGTIATSTTPGSTCTVRVNGPSPLKTGDSVTGTFHCENMGAYILKGPNDGHYHPPLTSTADGTFDGVVP